MKTDLSETQVAPTRSYQYMSNKTRTSLVVGLYTLFVILTAIASIFAFCDSYLIGNVDRLNTSDLKMAFINTLFYSSILNILTAILSILTIIIFPFWVYRANSNARALNPTVKYQFTPRQSVVSFFIPILNVFCVYQALEEIWVASLKENIQKRSNIIAIWWVTFLLSGFLSGIGRSFSVSLHEDSRYIIIILMVASLLGMISAWAGIRIVKKVNRAQEGLKI